MNLVTRGIRNAFRNGIRTISLVVILGLSIGLALTMLVANKAVGNKITSVKSSIGNTITISPAGFNPGSDANNALTTTDFSKVQKLTHVSAVVETLTDRQSTTGSASFGGGRFGGSTATNETTTSLTSPTKLNAGSGGGRFSITGGNAGGASLPTNFSLPVSFLGTNDPSAVDGTTLTMTSGTMLSGTSDTNNALVSTDMASKNSLKVGSTFTAYNATLTVTGIFKSSSTDTSDGTVIVSLPALQRLSGQTGIVTGGVATVDSADNLTSVTNAIKTALGSNAQVENAQQQVDNTVSSLNSVKTVSLFSLIGAVVAGAVIILLTMIMVVRERKREIGVIKAIGGSNARIMGEFMIEALTLTILGAVVGLLIGVIGGQPVTKLLVNSNTTTTTSTTTTPSGFGGGGFQRTGGGGGTGTTQTGGGGFTRGFRNNGAVKGLTNIKAQIGWGILLDGFGAAVLISVIGSALAAGMISKVRPSEVLRSV